MTEQTAPPAGRHLAAEIATQPDDWLRVAARVGSVADALPRPGERVGVIGCGTSLYMAQSYAVLREQAGKRHLLERKPSTLTRKLTGTVEVAKNDLKSVKKMLGI